MNLRPYWQFYKECFLFIAGFAIVAGLFLGVLWSFILFVLVGPLVGYAGFTAVNSEQFYFYYNLGITKKRLLKILFIINLFFGIPVYAVLLLIIFLLFGNLTIT